MADVPVKLFRASTVRPNTSPTNPSTPVGEEPIIVNPPGTPSSVGAGAGLSIDGSGDIQLGNDGAGVIDISDTDVFENGFSLNYGDSEKSASFEFLDSETKSINNYDNGINSYQSDFEFQASASGASIRLSKTVDEFSQSLVFDSADNLIKITDTLNSKGLEYADDYESNFTARSLVTKQYVDGAVSGGLTLTSPITGYTVGANTALAATDTLLGAFGKIQGQITARVSGTIASGQVAFGTGVNTVGGDSGLFWDNVNKRVGVGTNTPRSTFDFIGLGIIQGTTESDSGQLGSELLTTGTSDASWTGSSFATGYTHIVGSTSTLTSTLAGVINTFYQITYTVTGRTAGSFTIAFGGFTSGNLTATGAVGPRATTTGTLVITPTSDFNGTIVLSIRVINASSASVTFNNSSGTVTNQIRISSINTNTFYGIFTGQRNTTGSFNSFYGHGAGQNNTSGNFNSFFGRLSGSTNTTGNDNSFFGRNTGLNNTTGSLNSFFGSDSGANNTTGSQNSFFGNTSGLSNTTGSQNSFFGDNVGVANTSGGNNSFFGANSGRLNTTGTNNVFVGLSSGQFNTTGASNLAIGANSGRLISSGANLTIANNSVFIGADSRANADNETNQIVIGHTAIGGGSNTITLGNTSIVSTRIPAGSLWVNTTSGTNTLDVNGTARIRTISNLGSTATRFLVASATGVISERTGAELVSDLGISGGSNWTVVGSDIYRNSSVAIGRTTIPTNATFAVQSRTATNNHTYFTTLNNGGTSHFSITQLGQYFFRAGADSNSGTFFQFTNLSGTNLFSINGFGQITTGFTGTASAISGIRYLTVGSPTTTFPGFTVKGDNATISMLVAYNSSNFINFEVNPVGGSILRASSTATNRFGLSVRKSSDDSVYFDVRGDGQIRIGQSGTTIGFWNATPIVQPTTGVAAATLVSNAGTTLTSTDTFDGYTLQQVVRALRNTGLLA